MENTMPYDGSLRKDLLQPLLDLLDDGVVVHDEHRRIHLVNRAAEQITGLTRDEIIGMDCHTAFPPHGVCGGQCAFKAGPSSAAQNRRDLVQPFTRADGRRMHLQVRSDPIVIDGQKNGALLVIRDVTEINDLRHRYDGSQSFHGMIGSSAKVMDVFETIRVVGNSEYPVLITGESGTGKELAARAIHKESRRHGGPFVPVNCGALPDNILESELFGHVRGAFTGAIRDKKGRFELAQGGTLFLDEVGELPVQMQVKLLRVLQEKTFERVGGEKSIHTDARIVAATNRNLQKMIAAGSFREDLYYRLCVVPIEVPPLRQRREDIPLIVDGILSVIGKETHNGGLTISPDALALMLEYGWPGNIRELINALQYASVHCVGGRIDTSHLPLGVRSGGPMSTTADTPAAGPMGLVDFDETNVPRSKLTRETVASALKRTGGNKVKAAKLLGVGRATLYRFLGRDGD